MRYLHHNIWHGLTIILGISLVVFGCTDTPTQDVTPTRGRPTEIGTKQEGTQASQANNRMAFELFSNLTQNKEDKNFFISPFSISHAIGMVLEGADQKTAEQIREALGIPQDVESEAYHRGVAYLFDQFQYDSNASKVHKEIAKIEKQLADLRAKAERLPTTRASNPKRRELLHEERMLVDNLNRQRSLVDDNECLITNSLWAEKSYIFSATFFENVAKHYGADSVFPADFRNSSDQERKRINDWVSKYTKSKINNAIPPGLLSKLTRLVLVNTIYFNGKWLEPFEKSSTEDQDFHLDAKEVIKVPMMYQYLSECSYAAFNADGSFFNTPYKILVQENQRGFLPPDIKEKDVKEVPATEEAKKKAEVPKYPADDGFHMVEMPYKGDKLSMIVVAPLSYDGLPRLEKMMTAGQFRQCVEKLRKRCVRTYLPRFDMEDEYSLVAMLQTLGMKNAFVMPEEDFDPETQADFSKMLASGETKLYIQAVIHKTSLEVNEEGTEAAATTIMTMCESAAPPMDRYLEIPFRPTFKADRPFLFFICDRELKTILFMGRVVRPEQNKGGSNGGRSGYRRPEPELPPG